MRLICGVKLAPYGVKHAPSSARVRLSDSRGFSGQQFTRNLRFLKLKNSEQSGLRNLNWLGGPTSLSVAGILFARTKLIELSQVDLFGVRAPCHRFGLAVARW